MRLSEAITQRPFSNGTEGDAWISKWCDYCVHDHALHNGREGDDGGGCDLIFLSMMSDFPCEDFPWPEAWLPEPDDGKFYLPSRMICAQFEACHKDECEGDPGAVERAERVAEVSAYWRGADA